MQGIMAARIARLDQADFQQHLDATRQLAEPGSTPQAPRIFALQQSVAKPES